MTKTRCVIVLLRNEVELARFPTMLQKNGEIAQVEIPGSKGRFDSSVKTFKTTPRKPALRAAMEQVMLSFKGYRPQTDRVTTLEAYDLEVSIEGF